MWHTCPSVRTPTMIMTRIANMDPRLNARMVKCDTVTPTANGNNQPKIVIRMTDSSVMAAKIMSANVIFSRQAPRKISKPVTKAVKRAYRSTAWTASSLTSRQRIEPWAIRLTITKMARMVEKVLSLLIRWAICLHVGARQLQFWSAIGCGLC